MAIFKIAYSVTFIGSTESLFRQYSMSHSPRDKTVRDFCFREADSAENQQAIQDILSFFDVQTVVDMFAGSGTTGLACLELGIDCILIEQNQEHYENTKQTFEFLGEKV